MNLVLFVQLPQILYNVHRFTVRKEFLDVKLTFIYLLLSIMLHFTKIDGVDHGINTCVNLSQFGLPDEGKFLVNLCSIMLKYFIQIVKSTLFGLRPRKTCHISPLQLSLFLK